MSRDSVPEPTRAPETTPAPEPDPDAIEVPSWQRISVGLVLHVLVILLVVKFVLIQMVVSYDGFWHLATGRIIVETGQVPSVDPFCFTTDGLRWVNLSWLAQLIAYRLYTVLGFAGPITAASWLFILSLVFSALHLRARKVSPLPALLALAAIFYGVLIAYGIRPRCYTFALLGLEAWLLALPDPEDRLPWPRALALTAAILLWNNLHGGFLFGYAVLGMDLVGTTFDAKRLRGQVVTRRGLLLGGIIVVGLLGFALHPHGVHALVHPLSFVTKQKFNALFNEFSPPKVFSHIGLVLALFVVVAGLGVALGPGRKVRARDVLMAAVFLVLSLKIRRALTPLLLLSAPVVAAHWTEAVAMRRGPARDLWDALAARLQPAVATLPITIAALLLVWTVVVVPGRTPPGVPGEVESPAIDPADFPVGAVPVLRSPAAQGRIFNVYAAGGMLDWTLYPERRVFVDGRADMHSGAQTLEDYLAVTRGEPGWPKVLDRHEIDLVLLERDHPTLAKLQRDLGWTVAWEDSRYRLLRRPKGD